MYAEIEKSLILQGQILALNNKVYTKNKPFNHIYESGFKVFSQFGEDGILQYLIDETKIQDFECNFIEFGVQNYLESNTRFLMMKDNWRGLIFDGDKNNIDFIQSQDFYWRYDLTAKELWINKNNIELSILNAGFENNIGILSIDIDGNDYWIWQSIDKIKPIILVIEWNSVFGHQFPVSIPYDPQFQREKAHYSNLYWGCSIAALEYLGGKKGYSMVGSNKAGNNLFFVRTDRLGRLEKKSSQSAYVESKFSDSRSIDGQLSYVRGKEKFKLIKDLTVIDVRYGTETTLSLLETTIL